MDTTLEELQQENNKLKNIIQQLEQENKECKIFFGYNEDMTIQEMQDYKQECEEEEQRLRDSDAEYRTQCEKTDKLADLVIRMDELHFNANELSCKLNKLGSNISSKQRSFISAFMDLKDSIDEEKLEKFFQILHNWITHQEDIADIDNRIKCL